MSLLWNKKSITLMCANCLTMESYKCHKINLEPNEGCYIQVKRNAGSVK